MNVIVNLLLQFALGEGTSLARRTRLKHGRLDEILAETKRRFQGGPLTCLVELIEPELLCVQAALRAGSIGQDVADSFAIKVEAFIEHLPQVFGPRFLFDSLMISAIRDDWGQQGTELPKMIVPLASDEWGHSTVTYARAAGASVPVDLIRFPDGADLGDADLLGYPFLCHELGHNALFTYDDVFGPLFLPALDEHINSLRRRALADRGAARQKAQDTMDQIRRLWGPSADHGNWSHEIAVDVIALWTCGPAYLAAIQDVLEAESLDPYQIGQSHPPYEVRSNALAAASDALGWGYYMGEIGNLMDAWRTSERQHQRTNFYVASADLGLTRSCVEAALSACRVLKLPRCDPSLTARLSERIDGGEVPEFGTELILSAWLARDRLDEGGYEVWESEVKRQLYESITS